MLFKISRTLYSWARGWIILLLVVGFVLYVAVTLPVLKAAPGSNIVSLDTQLFYTPDTAFATVASYGETSGFWIRMYLTWDLVNPLLYSTIICLVLSWLARRGFRFGGKLQILNVLPLAAGLFDILENICIVIMLSLFPAQPTFVAWLACLGTLSKMIFFGISTLLILFSLVKATTNRFVRQW